MECFLLPYPGPKVAEDPDFNGSSADFGKNKDDNCSRLLLLYPLLLCCLDPRFGAYLEDLVTQTLCPRNLVPKGARLKQISDHKKELVVQPFS
jgi:hypothetical protein